MKTKNLLNFFSKGKSEVISTEVAAISAEPIDKMLSMKDIITIDIESKKTNQIQEEKKIIDIISIEDCKIPSELSYSTPLPNYVTPNSVEQESDMVFEGIAYNYHPSALF